MSREAAGCFICRTHHADCRRSARGKVRQGRAVSTNPREDQSYLVREDTAFLTKAEIQKWEEGRTFSTDWAGNHFFMWAELLQPLKGKPVRVLEIGSWEGRSALYFLN